MEVKLDISRDSYNSYVTAKLIVDIYDNDIHLRIDDDDRKIVIAKKDWIKLSKLMELS